MYAMWAAFSSSPPSIVPCIPHVHHMRMQSSVVIASLSWFWSESSPQQSWRLTTWAARSGVQAALGPLASLQIRNSTYITQQRARRLLIYVLLRYLVMYIYFDYVRLLRCHWRPNSYSTLNQLQHLLLPALRDEARSRSCRQYCTVTSATTHIGECYLVCAAL